MPNLVIFFIKVTIMVMSGSRRVMDHLVKELRLSTGLSQKAFSDRFHIPVSTLRKWEQGSASPAPYVLRLLADAIPGKNPAYEEIPYRNTVFYFDRIGGMVLDRTGNAVRIQDDLDGVNRENLGLYLYELFQAYYALQKRFEEDCRFDRKDGIQWV